MVLTFYDTENTYQIIMPMINVKAVHIDNKFVEFPCFKHVGTQLELSEISYLSISVRCRRVINTQTVNRYCSQSH
jgi:hypothetical protein